MKSIIISLLLLILNCSASSQTVTADSIMMPKRYLKQAAADLLRYDDCKQEVGLLGRQVSTLKEVNKYLVSDTLAKAERISVLDARIATEKAFSRQIEANCNKHLQQYEKSLKSIKRQRVAGTVFTAIFAGFCGYMLHSIVK